MNIHKFKCQTCKIYFDLHNRNPRTMPCCNSNICGVCLQEKVHRTQKCSVCDKTLSNPVVSIDRALEQILKQPLKYLYQPNSIWNCIQYQFMTVLFAVLTTFFILWIQPHTLNNSQMMRDTVCGLQFPVYPYENLNGSQAELEKILKKEGSVLQAFTEKIDSQNSQLKDYIKELISDKFRTREETLLQEIEKISLNNSNSTVRCIKYDDQSIPLDNLDHSILTNFGVQNEQAQKEIQQQNLEQQGKPTENQNQQYKLLDINKNANIESIKFVNGSIHMFANMVFSIGEFSKQFQCVQGSTLVRLEDVLLLQSWIPNSLELELIYKGTRDGFQSYAFYAKCKGIPKTLIVIQNEHYKIFGGYASVAWQLTLTQKNQTDENAFIFSLSHRQKFDIKKDQKSKALYFNPSYGPRFGDDIQISDNCNQNKNSFIGFGNTYNTSNTKLTNIDIAGSQWFKVNEIEVYKIK